MATAADNDEEPSLAPGSSREGRRGWKWETSLSKEWLMKKLWNGEIPEDATPMEVFMSYTIFAEETNYCSTTKNRKETPLWPGRLRSARNFVSREKKAITDATDGYQRDRHLYPMTTHDSQGRPHWKGSEAHTIVLIHVKQAFDDLADGTKILRKERLTDNRVVKTMIQTNAHAFREYTKAVIKKKIDQEDQTILWYNTRKKLGLNKQKSDWLIAGCGRL